MGDGHFISGRRLTALLLILAGSSLPSYGLTGQTIAAPAVSSAASSVPLPADLQAQLDKLQNTLNAARTAGDTKSEATTFNQIGELYFRVSDFRKALEAYNQALPPAQSTKDSFQEAAALNGIADCYRSLGQNLKALNVYQQVLDIATTSGDELGQATALNGIGWVDNNIGQNQKALESHHRALLLARKLGDSDLEATILRRIGDVYYSLGDKQKALECQKQALAVSIRSGDRRGQGRALGNLGVAYSDLGEMQKSLDYFAQAVPILHEVGDRGAEGIGLSNIGEIYSSLGEQLKALEYFNQALPLLREIGDPIFLATTLNNIAFSCALVGEQQTALFFYNRALPIFRNAGDRGGEAMVLLNIGATNFYLKDQQKALEYFNQALPIFREIGDRSGEASTLNTLSFDYEELGEQQKALEALNQALPLSAEVGNPLLEAAVFYSLLRNQRASQPSLAIFYGKQSVNLLQQVRGNIKGLDKSVQAGFLASRNDYYHDLADVLIAQGRLSEAQQVLDLLKQQEYSDYTRGDSTNTLSPLTLTPAERQAAEDYQKSTVQLVTLGEQFAQLKKTSARTPEQEQQYQQISDQINAASKGLNDYYSRLYVLFGNKSDVNNQVADVKGKVNQLQQTIAEMPHTVALYTLVGKDRYRVIVIAGKTPPVAREYEITEEELNKKIAAFDQVLRNPALDPRPLAEELYKILIGPVKGDLDQAKAQTIVWSLDGVLRYVPMAALYDGKQYVVENYDTVTITPASITHLSEKPDVSNLSTVAMGISRKYEGLADPLPPLPAVAGELNDIVKDPQAHETHGVLPGTILLNDQFTVKAMETQLAGQHAVVHIASHFVFKPGDDIESYLLLAGKDEGGHGYRLTVADFRDNPKLSLDDTDLLTLSACDTGMSGSASNGREVDGLGTTAQLKGAKAVISSLWEVDDSSTGELMADFYHRWATGEGKVAKVEALRQAQLDLLLGKVRPQADSIGRGFVNVKASNNAPAGFAHPFYWAPFVLMGNWK